MKEKKQINYEKRPIPSGPGSQQITVEGQESKKGGSAMTSTMPKKHVIPGDSKKK
jgi:hypothetical protein